MSIRQPERNEKRRCAWLCGKYCMRKTKCLFRLRAPHCCAPGRAVSLRQPAHTAAGRQWGAAVRTIVRGIETRAGGILYAKNEPSIPSLCAHRCDMEECPHIGKVHIQQPERNGNRRCTWLCGGARRVPEEYCMRKPKRNKKRQCI